MLKRGVEPGTKTYLRELVVWGPAGFRLLTTIVVVSQGGFGFLKDLQGWNWGRVAESMTATAIASWIVAIATLWSLAPTSPQSWSSGVNLVFPYWLRFGMFAVGALFCIPDFRFEKRLGSLWIGEIVLTLFIGMRYRTGVDWTTYTWAGSQGCRLDPATNPPTDLWRRSCILRAVMAAAPIRVGILVT